MKFEESPNYTYIKNLIKQIAVKNQLVFDNNKFEWMSQDSSGILPNSQEYLGKQTNSQVKPSNI